MYIEELKTDLKGRMLDIWRGHDDNGNPINMSLDLQEAYRNKWRSRAGVEIPPVKEVEKTVEEQKLDIIKQIVEKKQQVNAMRNALPNPKRKPCGCGKKKTK